MITIEELVSDEFQKKRIALQDKVFTAIDALLRAGQSCGFRIEQDGMIVTVEYIRPGTPQ